MESAIEKYTILSLLVIGLSHTLQPRAWAEFFILLRSKGKVGVFLTAFLHLPLGLFIISFHNVWTWPAWIITVIGWGWTVKGFLYFCFPRVGLWSLSRVSLERAHEFAIPGAIFMLFSAWLAYALLLP